MAILGMDTPRRKGVVRGRESLNKTLTTSSRRPNQLRSRLRRKQMAKPLASGCAMWPCRCFASADATEVVLTEVVGLRLFLNNILKSMTMGGRLTPEAFATLLDNVKAHKGEVARDLLRSRQK
jgi:hypothetical protein